jgi:hypothetical protein
MTFLNKYQTFLKKFKFFFKYETKMHYIYFKLKNDNN